jgi:hypothetical protein
MIKPMKRAQAVEMPPNATRNAQAEAPLLELNDSKDEK